MLPSFTEFYWVLPSFTEFYRVLLSVTEFYRVLLCFTEFYLVLLSLLGFTELYFRPASERRRPNETIDGYWFFLPNIFCFPLEDAQHGVDGRRRRLPVAAQLGAVGLERPGTAARRRHG